MSLMRWITEFEEAHGRARRALMLPVEMADYLEQRNELARMLLGAQQLLLAPGQQPRKALRVARAFNVELGFPSGPLRTRTLDISAGGFAVTLDDAVAPGTCVPVKLVLPRDGVVEAQAMAVSSKASYGQFRVAFTLPTVSEDDRDRIEFAVFDAVLDILSS